MEGLLRLAGLLLAVGGVIVLAWGLLRRAGSPGEASVRDAGLIAAGSALALAGLALRALTP